MSILKKSGQNEEIFSEKKGIFLYFELLFRKFWNYITLNLLYALTSTLTFVFYWVIFGSTVVPIILSTISDDVFKIMADSAGGMDVELFKGSLIWAFSCIFSLLVITFFGGGVCSIGYNYILRNYARQENAYIFSDFFEQIKKNFKQSLFLSIIDKVIISILCFSASYYYYEMTLGGGYLYIIAFALMIFALLVYGAMHTYLWTIMVTFKVTMKQAFKNSLMLVLGTAVRSIGYIFLMVIFAVISVIIFANSQMLMLVLFMVILFSAFNLAGHLCSYPVIKKYMIDNTNEKINESGCEDNG